MEMERKYGWGKEWGQDGDGYWVAMKMGWPRMIGGEKKDGVATW